MSFDRAIQTLRFFLDDARTKSPAEEDWNAAQIAAARSQVLGRYGPVFSHQNLAKLDRATFLGFLKFENNRHWNGLERLGDKVTRDMDGLRNALSLLVDEALPIKARLDRIHPKTGPAMVPYLGQAILTAILQVVYPDKYGVLNRTTKAGMEVVGLWSEPIGLATTGDHYEAVNKILISLASALGTDLWTLDSLWWKLVRFSPLRSKAAQQTQAEGPGSALPRQLPAETRSTGVISNREAIALPSGLKIAEATAEARLLRFCKEEYEYYDGIFTSCPDRIEPIDILVTISMNSRIDDAPSGFRSSDRVRRVHRGLMERCNALLPAIPLDANLLTFDPQLRVFRELIHAAVQAPQVLTAVATKVLHRKRRGFIPMLDNVILDYYLDACGRPDLKAQKGDKPRAADVAVEVMKSFRDDLRHCLQQLTSIQLVLANAGFHLNTVRILEILVWTETEPNGYYKP